MGEVNTKILQSALKAWGGQLPVSNNEAGICLKVVREIVQDALGIGYEEFYRRYLIKKAIGTPANIPAARDVQRSLRLLGLSVKEPKAGDLVFSWKMAYPYGHVGIMLSENIFLENVASNRPFAKRGFLGLSHLDSIKGLPIEFFSIRE